MFLFLGSKTKDKKQTKFVQLDPIGGIFFGKKPQVASASSFCLGSRKVNG